MNAKAAIIPIPPVVSVNKDPGDRFDLLVGDGASFYSAIIRALRFNLTIVPSTTGGRCIRSHQGNITCTGTAKLLFDGDADFSLMEGKYNSDPGINQMQLLTPGVPLYAAEASFMSGPASGETDLISDVGDTIARVWMRTLATIICLSCFVLLINLSPKFKFVRRLSPAAVPQIMFQRSNWKFIVAHRRVAVIFSLFLVFMFTQMFMAGMQTGLVLVIPAKYLQTFEEIAESNRSTAFFGGMGIDDSFRESGSKTLIKIAERAVVNHMVIPLSQRNSVFLMAQAVREKDAVLFTSPIKVRDTVTVISCMQSEYRNDEAIRFSRPFDSETTTSIYRPGIGYEMRQRLDHVFQRFVETGLYYKYTIDPFSSLKSIIDIEKAVACFQKFKYMDQKDGHSGNDVIAPVTVVSMGFMRIVFPALALVAGIAFLMELLLRRPRERSAKGASHRSPVVVVIISHHWSRAPPPPGSWRLLKGKVITGSEA